MRLDVLLFIVLVFNVESDDNPYDLLGVSPSATEAEIRIAYRKLALNTHPDRNSGPNANEEFQRVNSAYKMLSDKTRRSEYDKKLSSMLQKNTFKRSPILVPAIIWSVTSAVINGIIGVSVDKLFRDYGNVEIKSSTGICLWYGTAPICNGQCPDSFDQLRVDSGRCGIPNTQFGKMCGTGTKVFCCREDRDDLSWAGRWTHSWSAEVMRCKYSVEPPAQRCGALYCTQNGKHIARNITGEACNQIELFDEKAIAYPGYMRLEKHAYYKTSG